MAWPFTRLTTYVGGSTPPIYAEDLNDIQDYLGHIFTGDKTVKKLVADGTGDQTPHADYDNGDLGFGHLVGGGSAPSASAGAAAGTGATVTLTDARDSNGRISVTTGSVGTATTNGTVATVTFNRAYQQIPHVVLTPVNDRAAKAMYDSQVYVDSTASTFLIKVGNASGVVPLADPSIAHSWHYHVIGRH